MHVREHQGADSVSSSLVQGRDTNLALEGNLLDQVMASFRDFGGSRRWKEL